MPQPDAWKAKVKRELDKAKEDGQIDKKTYEKLKKALEAADSAASFASDYLTNSGGLWETLGKKSPLKLKGLNQLISIFTTLLEAGPCPWTGIAAAKIRRRMEEMHYDFPGTWPRSVEVAYRKLNRLHRWYSNIFSRHSRMAYGRHWPQDINVATVRDVQRVPGVNAAVARRIVAHAKDLPFLTPDEALRVPGVNIKLVNEIIYRGFYFGPTHKIATRKPKKKKSLIKKRKTYRK